MVAQSTFGLRELASHAAWHGVGTLHNTSFRETDLWYDVATGQYYLFSTASYLQQGAIDLYVGATPEELFGTPIRLAPTGTSVTSGQSGVYPSAHKDPATGIWHLYATVAHSVGGATGGTIRHFTTTTPTNPTSWALVTQSGYTFNTQLTDVQIRKHPSNGLWYAVGFPQTTSAPLTVVWADTPHGMGNVSGGASGGSTIAKGLWRPISGGTSFNGSPHVVIDQASGDTTSIFANTGYPIWAAAARPDPNLAFTDDGRCYVLFSGFGNAEQTIYGRGAVEVDLSTGRAKGPAVQIPDPVPSTMPSASPFYSDLSYVAIPGQTPQIFGFTNDNLASGTATPGDYPLGVLDLADYGFTMIKDALVARLQGIAGMSTETVLAYWPESVVAPALISVLLEDYEPVRVAGAAGMRYHVLVRVWVPWQDSAGAESAADALLDAIPAAIYEGPRALGLSNVNDVTVLRGEAGFIKVGGADTRFHDHHVEVLQKNMFVLGG